MAREVRVWTRTGGVSSLSKHGESAMTTILWKLGRWNWRRHSNRQVFHPVPFWFKMLPELPGCIGCSEGKDKTGSHPEMVKKRRQCLELVGTAHNALAMAPCWRSSAMAPCWRSAAMAAVALVLSLVYCCVCRCCTGTEYTLSPLCSMWLVNTVVQSEKLNDPLLLCHISPHPNLQHSLDLCMNRPKPNIFILPGLMSLRESAWIDVP